MGHQTAWDITVTGRNHRVTLNGHDYKLGEALAAADWLWLGARRRRMFLDRGIVELLPRCVGRPRNGDS